MGVLLLGCTIFLATLQGIVAQITDDSMYWYNVDVKPNQRLYLREIEAFSVSGKKLDNYIITDTQMDFADRITDGNRLPCAPVAVNYANSLNFYVTSFHGDPLETLNIYIYDNCDESDPDKFINQAFTVRVDEAEFKYELKKGDVTLANKRDVITVPRISKKLTHQFEDWKIEIKNRIRDLPIVFSEIEAFRIDGTKMKITTDTTSGYYSGDTGTSTPEGATDGQMRVPGNCDAALKHILHTKHGEDKNFWSGKIEKLPDEQIAKIVIHGRHKECVDDIVQFTRQRYDVFLNGIKVFSVEEAHQNKNVVTLYLEPVEIYQTDNVPRQIQMRGIVPIFNSTNGLATDPVFVYPEQSGFVEPYIPPHAVDGRNNGKCDEDATCILTDPNSPKQSFTALLISEEGHQVSGVKVFDNIDESANSKHVKGSTLYFRHKHVPLESYNGEESNTFLANVERRSCQCTEASGWFGCPAAHSDDNQPCTLTTGFAPTPVVGGSKVCKGGFISTVAAGYETELEQVLSELRDAQDVVTYHTKLLNVIDIVSCIRLPLQVARTSTVTSHLVDGAFKLLSVLDKYRLVPGETNTEKIDEPLLNTLTHVLRSQAMQLAYPEAIQEGTRRLPMYSMQRVLALPKALSQWEFLPESKWTQQLQALRNELAFPSSQGEVCTALFDGLKADSTTESAIATQNVREIAGAIEALNTRVTIAQEGLVQTGKIMQDKANSLDEAIETMRRKIEEYREAKLKSDLFNSIIKVVVAAVAVMAAIAATVATSGTTAVVVAAALEQFAEALDPLVEVVEAGVEIANTVRDMNEQDETELKLLADAGYDIDVGSFAFENANFNSNVRAITSELQVLTQELSAFLTLAATRPESIQGTKIRETKMNPLVWDLILTQLITQFEATNICVPPDLSEIRRLDTISTSTSQTTALRQRQEMHHSDASSEQDGNEFGRVLIDKAAEEREAAKESVVDMQQKCRAFIGQFTQVTQIGKMMHMDLVEITSLIREFRTAAYSKNAYAQNAKSWEAKSQVCDDLVNKETEYKLILQTQVALLGLMEEQDLIIAQNRLIMVCETIDYVLNLPESVCDRKEIFLDDTTIPRLNTLYQTLKEKYEAEWTARINSKSKAFHSLDVTHLIDMEKVKGISESSNAATDFEFVLTPDDIPRNHILRCQSNVELEQLALVFRGADEDGAGSYSTNIVVSGPFLKKQVTTSETTEPVYSVFLPRRAYEMAFQYELHKDDTCNSAEGSMTKVCGRQICSVSSGENQDLDGKTVALPTLFATYRVQVSQLGKSGLKNSQSVHIVYKGRWTTDSNTRCVTEVEECEWNLASEFPTIPVVTGLLGGIALGGIVYVKLVKAAGGKSNEEQVSFSQDELQTKSDGPVSPRFSL